MVNEPDRADSAVIADALGILLQRRFRAGLYTTLTVGVHEALDAAAYPVISGVARCGPISAAALSQQIGLDRSIVSRRAAALVTAGLLKTSPDPDDRRASLLTLTGQGRRAVATLRQRLNSALDTHLADWSPRQRHDFARLLAKFVEPGTLTGPG